MVNTIHTIGRFCGNFKSISKSALSKTYQLTRKTVDEKSKNSLAPSMYSVNVCKKEQIICTYRGAARPVLFLASLWYIVKTGLKRSYKPVLVHQSHDPGRKWPDWKSFRLPWSSRHGPAATCWKRVTNRQIKTVTWALRCNLGCELTCIKQVVVLV